MLAGVTVPVETYVFTCAADWDSDYPGRVTRIVSATPRFDGCVMFHQGLPSCFELCSIEPVCDD